MTTKSNIAARLSGFQINELPRTLKEAIRTVRALGIDFIWIDAVCIIQDDTEDWSREASRMGKIYNHAYLTIAATNSKSSFDGFLQDREPSCRASLGFVFKGVQPPHSQTAVNETGIIHFRYPLETSVDDHLSNCDWNQRGWTLQENLLSTRTLYFTKDVIYYECVTSQKVESPGYKFPAHREFSVLLAESKSLPLAERIEIREEYLSNWYKIVEIYSRRNLTCPRDKLPAMEGLAGTLGDLIDDVYIYGLWKSDLHRSLLWHSYYSLTWKLPRGGYRAPTWSWASRDGSVFWDKSTFKRGWRSLVEDFNISPPQKCAHCDQTRGVRLELVALVAPVKDVLLAYDQPNDDGRDPDDWEELSSWDEYDELGSLCIDDDGDMPLFLADTHMILIAEKAETKNIQAILVQPYGDSNCFKRIGWFIHKPSQEAVEEEDFYDRDFEPIRKVFKSKRMILV